MRVLRRVRNARSSVIEKTVGRQYTLPRAKFPKRRVCTDSVSTSIVVVLETRVGFNSEQMFRNCALFPKQRAEKKKSKQRRRVALKENPLVPTYPC